MTKVYQFTLAGDKWQLDWLENMLLTFGEFREVNGERVRRFHYIRYDTCIHVKIYDIKLWKQFCNNSRLP